MGIAEGCVSKGLNDSAGCGEAGFQGTWNSSFSNKGVACEEETDFRSGGSIFDSRRVAGVSIPPSLEITPMQGRQIVSEQRADGLVGGGSDGGWRVVVVFRTPARAHLRDHQGLTLCNVAGFATFVTQPGELVLPVGVDEGKGLIGEGNIRIEIQKDRELGMVGNLV